MALDVVLGDLRKDREVTLEAVRQEGWALKFATPERRASREIVAAAVQSRATSLRFASKDLQALGVEGLLPKPVPAPAPAPEPEPASVPTPEPEPVREPPVKKTSTERFTEPLHALALSSLQKQFTKIKSQPLPSS